MKSLRDKSTATIVAETGGRRGGSVGAGVFFEKSSEKGKFAPGVIFYEDRMS